MSGYVSYLAPRYERLTEELPAQHEELRGLLRGELPGATLAPQATPLS